MSGLVYLLALVGMVALVAWVIKNDTPGSSGKTIGVFAMKEPDDTAEADRVKRPPPYIG